MEWKGWHVCSFHVQTDKDYFLEFLGASIPVIFVTKTNARKEGRKAAHHIRNGHINFRTICFTKDPCRRCLPKLLARDTCEAVEQGEEGGKLSSSNPDSYSDSYSDSLSDSYSCMNELNEETPLQQQECHRLIIDQLFTKKFSTTSTSLCPTSFISIFISQFLQSKSKESAKTFNKVFLPSLTYPYSLMIGKATC